jgi:hypothetical protein
VISRAATIRVDRVGRSKHGAPPHGLDPTPSIVETTLALAIVSVLLLALILVGVVMVAEWLVRRSHEAIRRNAHRLGRGTR